tara:strand:- start:44 stop:316 length:273 start_codon:yes stop_codon:yes gene_type:complete
LVRGVLPKVKPSLKPLCVSTTGAYNMSVDNPKGGTVVESTHSVKTINKAREWYSQCVESELPIKINQQDADGRLRVRVYDNNDKMVSSKG